MERNAEYLMLREELNHTQNDLDFALSRACTRLRQKKRLRMFTVPARAILALAVVFVLLVNLSWSFALACSGVPVLSDLAAAVAFSPSLKAMVQYGYVQYFKQEQTQNGLTMKIEYLVVDQKQINIYYKLHDEAGKSYSVFPESVVMRHGEFCDIVGMRGDGVLEGSDGLRCVQLEIGNADVPRTLRLTFVARELIPDGSGGFLPSENKAAEFMFSIGFNPDFTRQAEVYTINQSFTLDGQTFTVTTVEVFPTQTRVNLEADAANTSWITELFCYIEDESGTRYDRPEEGMLSTIEDDTPMRNAFRLESPYFGGGKQLTLHILGAALLDKDAPSVKVDLKNNTAHGLPDGITFVGTEREDDLVRLRFSLRRTGNLLYRSESGNDVSLDSRYYSLSDPSVKTARENFQGYSEYDPETQEETYLVNAGESSVVYLLPAYTRIFEAQSPIFIEIK